VSITSFEIVLSCLRRSEFLVCLEDYESIGIEAYSCQLNGQILGLWTLPKTISPASRPVSLPFLLGIPLIP